MRLVRCLARRSWSGVITRRSGTGRAPVTRLAAGCRRQPGRGGGWMRLRRRSRSGCIGRAARSAPTQRTRSCSAWAIRVRSARRAERSRMPSGVGGPSTGAGRGRGSRSRGCGCSSTTADGPEIAGRSTVLFCAWLAWSRFRVVIPLWDRTMPSVVMALDRALRRFGGAPTYALTDNEKSVSVDHVAGIAVRNPQIVSVGRHYGISIATCVPADPQSKGGSEATVRIAKADLVPTDHNLRGAYEDFAALEQACAEFCDRVNAREHRITRRPPTVMLVEERDRLHRLPQLPHTVCFGQTRKVSWQSTISVGGAIYSVPSTLVDERVWARADGTELVVVHADGSDGPREVARHGLTTPGRPSIREEHYPPRPAGALERKPRASTADERAFLAIGPGAEKWLKAAAAAGTTKLRRKVAEATALAKLRGHETVEEALTAAADAGRFGDGDLAAILAYRGGQVIAFPARASEERSLQRSTRSWEGFGA